MASTVSLKMCSLLLMIYFMKIVMSKRFITETCQGDYSEGSLLEPCGLCQVCKKKWDEKSHTTINSCYLNILMWETRKQSPFILASAADGGGKFCKLKQSCHTEECKYARENEEGKKVCDNLLDSYKCGCQQNRYGQNCEYTIPPELSIDSFADIKSVLYKPYIYSSEYLALTIYFFTTGADFALAIETERELLRYDSRSCKTNIIDVSDYCDSIFSDSGLVDYYQICMGKPTFEEHWGNEICAITVNIAFPRVQTHPWDEKKLEKYFIRDYEEESEFPNRTTVAKPEIITMKVFNNISTVGENATIFINEFGVLVFYVGKNHFQTCPPIIMIDKYGKSMYNVPSFPRRHELSVTSSVVLKNSSECENLGDPVLNWYVWKITVNHDERNDPPFYQLLKTTVLIFRPFELEYGLYKVKHEVRLTLRHFNIETTYCYFQIIPLPLRPLIIGGNLRYIYSNSNLELITAVIIDPNFPPDDQPTMTHTWYCNDTTEEICNKLETKELVHTVQGPFKAGNRYNFTLRVETSLSISDYSQIIVVSQEPIPNLLIECLRNCGGKDYKSDTKEIFYFKVKHSQYSAEMIKGSSYNWTCFTNGSEVVNIKDIRQLDETPSWILIVNQDALKNDQEYTFKVVGGGKWPGEAQISIKTFKHFDTFKCDINPRAGIAGETMFEVACSEADDEHSKYSLTVTFYDKYDKNEVSGRFLGSSFVESIKDIVLTRGTVVVYATNMYGQFLEAHVTVTLTTPSITGDFLKKHFNMLWALSRSQGYEQKVSYISAFCDILNKMPPVKYIAIETFLEIMSKEKPTSLVKLELLLSTVMSVICDGDNCTATHITGRSYGFLSEILSGVSRKLTSEILSNLNIPSELTTFKLESMYTTLLKCVGVLVTVQDDRLVNKTYPSIDYRVYELYKFGNLEAIKSLESVNKALVLRNLPYIKESFTQTEYIVTWMKEDIPAFFINGTKRDYGGSFVKISEQLAQSLGRNLTSIVLQTIEFKQNPYWWSQTAHITTEVVSLNIGYKTEYQSYTLRKVFNPPVDIFLKKHSDENVTITGKVTQPDSETEIDIKDLTVSVHKLYPLKGAKISVKFVDLEENDTFRVTLKKNLRPDYDHLDDGMVITKSSPWCHSLEPISDTDDIVFIGILPGSEVSVGTTLHYKFQMKSTRCQVWYDNLWATTGCNAGSESTEEHLHCQCNHLSSIAGLIGVPINTVDPFTDYKLFLTLPENPFVFAFVLTIFLLFIILLVWCIKKDREDVQKTSLIVLDDNISTDRFGYLVTVFTGSRLFAGTTSNIGIIIHGSESTSRSHILHSHTRATLKRNNDDWFLIFAPKYLGIISSIQLWTDHSGDYPNWFCDKIHIHDLTSRKDYTFLVGKWFGITQAGTRIESFVRPIKLEKEEYYVEFFLTNTIFGFRESHLWISILSRHPRSPVARAQRLSMAMVALLMTLLTSIMFYDAVMPNDEDAPSYDVSMQDFLISVYSLAISAAVTAVVYFCFSKSYVYEEFEDESFRNKSQHHKTTSGARMHVDSIHTLKLSKTSERNVKYYLKKVILSLRKEHFYPVQTKKDSERYQFLVVHKIKAIFAWILCMCIILVVSFFIILYGLKIGKVKSLLWLTSTGMSLGGDIFVVDPGKILLISMLFGLVQTQVCDLYAYDPNIYNMRQGFDLKIDLDRDKNIHQMRFKNVYKHISEDRLEIIKKQQRKIENWWSFIDIFDILFSVIAMFFIISHGVFKEYTIHSHLTKILFEQVNSGENYISTPIMRDISSYSRYLQNTIFPAIYLTRWYNGRTLTAPSELFPNTGWIQDSTHRIIGVPRLRQIRVQKQACTIPTILRNFSFYCNVLYSQSTEDTDDHGTQWSGSSWDDIMFSKSPWKYFYPEESSSVSMYGESGELFHGGGYVGELKRSRRESVDTILNLLDASWLDMKTRVIFFEMTAYNTNINVFTSIVLITEHLESTLILSGKRIWFVIISQEHIVIEVILVFYVILGLTKLLMVFNTVGARLFFSSFWTLYDFSLIAVVTVYFIGNRIILLSISAYAYDFQKEGKDTFFQFQTLIFYLQLARYLLGLLFILLTVRMLRLLKYGTSIISKKQRYTVYFSCPKLVWVTLVLIAFMFVLQRLVAYLINAPYEHGLSHLILHKLDFLHLYNNLLFPEKKFFIFLLCFISYLTTFIIMIILIESYSFAHFIYEREKLKTEIK